MASRGSGFKNRSNDIGVPRWILFVHALQLLFAFFVIALTAYALSIYRGGPTRPALITTLIVAVLTILPILPLVTPLHLTQRQRFDPQIALALDISVLFFWLGAFVALASYHDIYSNYGRGEMRLGELGDECVGCRGAWRAGVAATVFAAMEFILFFITTLIFTFYYHHHRIAKSASTSPRTSTYGSRNSYYIHPSSIAGGAGTGVAGSATAHCTPGGPHSPAPRHPPGTYDYEMSALANHTNYSTTNITHTAPHPRTPNSNSPIPSPLAMGGYGGSAAIGPTAPMSAHSTPSRGLGAEAETGRAGLGGAEQGPPSLADSPITRRQGGYGGLEGGVETPWP